jgi:glycosyltransferase involved in cell wall biosynthesis
MPYFSIIIATYNSEDLIERSISSIINQTFKDFEIIIVDGKSKDKTLNLVHKYSNVIKKIISEPDQGIYDAWNKGVNIAEGEWILFIGSDDILANSALNDYFNFISNSNFKLDYVSSKVELIDFKANIKRIIGKPWSWKIFKKYMCVAHVGSIHSKYLFDNLGYFNTDYKITGDYEFLLRAKKNLNSGFLDKVTAQMQIGGVSVNNRSFFETYKAKTNTGGRNKIISFFELIIAYMIHIFRKFIS